MAHDARDYPCCIFADEDQTEQDPELYDCDECPVADALHDLDGDPKCAEAWSIFRKCVNRFTVETHCVPTALAAATAGKEPDDVMDLLERCELMFDILHPPPEPKG
jgi:hypothetical protein